MRPPRPVINPRQRGLRLAGQLLSITALVALWQLLDGWFGAGNPAPLLWGITLLFALVGAAGCFRLARAVSNPADCS